MKLCTVIAWNGRRPAFYEDGQAWVKDPVSNTFTSCHSLTPAQVARVKRLANRDTVVLAGPGVTTLLELARSAQ